jgi:hypothetical protein
MGRVAFCIEVLTELQEVRPAIASAVRRGMREGEFIREDRSGIVLINVRTKIVLLRSKNNGKFLSFPFPSSLVWTLSF